MKQFITFVETKVFSKRISGLISDDAFAEFQTDLGQNPGRGSVIEGTGGLRKIRCKVAGKGKSGGLRIIYLYVRVRGQIHLVFVYAKNQAEDLTPDQKRALKGIVERIKQEYRK
jgi:hypothetical protein